MREEETQHISDKSKPFSLLDVVCICDFADSVRCVCTAWNTGSEMHSPSPGSMDHKASNNILLICFIQVPFSSFKIYFLFLFF